MMRDNMAGMFVVIYVNHWATLSTTYATIMDKAWKKF